MNFSLLISVYIKDNHSFFEKALHSIYQNTILPSEVVLICDGPLSDELNQVINKYLYILPLSIHRLDINQGLGKALSIGLTHCQYDWVARFDADDICAKNRFEKQLIYIKNHPNVDVIGGRIQEFNEQQDVENTFYKNVPLEHKEIYKYAKSRNPINHMTVMFRKSAVLDAGGYQHAPLYEDYDLWVRMLLKGYKFANLVDVLVYARAGIEMYERRGGLAYAKQEALMQVKFYNLGFLTWYDLLKNLMIRMPVRMMPNRVRRLFYRKFLRL